MVIASHDYRSRPATKSESAAQEPAASHAPLTAYLVYPFDPFAITLGGGIRYLRGLAVNLGEAGADVVVVGVRRVQQAGEDSRFRFRALYHGESTWWLFLLILALGGWRLKIPQTAVIHTFHPLFALGAMIWYPRNQHVCTIMGQTFHVVELRHPRLGGILYGVYTRLEALALRLADVVMAPGQAIRLLLQERHPYTWLPGKIVMTESGVETSEFRPMDKAEARRRYSIDPDDLVVMFAGRMEPVKNLDFLLRGYQIVQREVPRARLVLVGDGSERERIVEKATRTALRFHWLGVIPPLEMPVILNSADMVVLCSHSEASPTILREALACGVPVVSTDVGDAKEVVTNLVGRIASSNETAFASAILEISSMKSNPQVAEDCRARATCLGIEKVAKNQLGLYEEIASFRVGRRSILG